MAAYAKGTSVSVAKSKAEIEDQVTRFGADGFMSGRDGRNVMIAFKARERQVMFRMLSSDPNSPEMKKTPTGKTRREAEAIAACEAEDRRLWRSLAMSIKAKLVGVVDGIETFEQAFMAHVVMPDGLTLSDHITDKIEIAYDTGAMPPLLPLPPKDND